MVIESQRNPFETQLTDYIKELFAIGNKAKDELRMKTEVFGEIMFNDTAPHCLIQSHYISLCAHVDIYYAMNYILSAFCNGFDEVAVVTLLKKLSAVCGRTDGKSFRLVRIIKAIWDGIFQNVELKDAVLNYGYDKKNVASYSLNTLAIHHMDCDSEILDLLMRLFNESIAANQQITLKTFYCIIWRLEKISRRFVTQQQTRMIETIWAEVVHRLQHHPFWDDWVETMRRISHKFALVQLRHRIRAFELVMQQRNQQ